MAHVTLLLADGVRYLRKGSECPHLLTRYLQAEIAFRMHVSRNTEFLYVRGMLQVLEVLQPSKLNAGESTRWMFDFNRVIYGGTQEEVFQETLLPALDRALEGVNSLVLLCGRKGTGKTYTSCGEDANFDYRGMIPRALHKVFEEIGHRGHEFDIRVRWVGRLDQPPIIMTAGPNAFLSVFPILIWWEKL